MIIDDSDLKQQMTIVENGVNYNIKRYNDLRVFNERLTLDLKVKLDELDDQKSSYEELTAMKNATTDESMRIESLHHDTDLVQRQIHEKMHYSRRLEHMLNRLKSNQLKFDAHMTGMEETMRNIQKDGAEVRLMRRGLDAGLAKAVVVLEDTKMNLQVARKDRDVLMDQRRAEYRNAKMLQDWLLEREKMKVELGIELRGDLTLEEERFLQNQIDDKQEKTRNLQRASEEGLKKLQSMDEAFTKLKQVTGVKNVEEMHEKFSNQKSNKLQLELEVKDAEHRLAAAKKAHQKQEAIFQELKSSGSGLTELNRESINKLEEAFSEARNDQKFIRADSERISAVLLGLHQGSQGLLQRVQPYHSLAEGGVFELTQLGEESSPWTEAVDALTTAEHVLTKMTEAISGDGATVNPGGGFEEDEDNDSHYSHDSHSMDTMDEAPNLANNVRIKSKRFLRDSELEEEYVPGLPGMQEDLTEMHLPAVAELTITVPLVSVDDTKVSVEAKRKEEMEVRRKKLLDRMENKAAPGDGDGKQVQDDVRIVLTAKYKAQRVSGDRLSVGHKPPTLPDGVTMRDDPMTKTIAFLNSQPKLS
ncbi:hypothetical protein B484DRAFT_397878 [Ochromonadaceae sp. CCMP2298]|nr:hypothetical protein B484DRAFT_397878 [Ochromonadaceae sp. CCMP2298]